MSEDYMSDSQAMDRTKMSGTPAMAEPTLSTADIAAGRTEPLVEKKPAAASAPMDTPFFPDSEANTLRSEWTDVQTSFVDEPRRAVEQADQLVAGAMKRIAETFAEERSNLERQWDSGEEVSTEDLRIALQRYRSFFGRLLSI